MSITIVPPAVKAMMTGANRCFIDGNVATLHYVDGSTETAKIQPKNEYEWLALVEEIQAQR